MNKQQKQDDGISPFGKIPKHIWEDGEWFIGKIQLPLGGTATGEALIYDDTKEWKLFIPIDWTKEIDFHGKLKAYFWMWFDKLHAINIESEVIDVQYW